MGTERGEQILAVAAREIGYHEGPGKHNKYGEWYGMDGVPWCMEFVQWVYHQCGGDLPLKTASCGGLLNWYRRNDPECVTKTPVLGCIVIFDFPGTPYPTDHTGIFVRLGSDRVTTIDGNTGGIDANGGWVQQKTRKLSYANPTYIVPRWLTEEDKREDELDMTKEEFLASLTDAEALEIVERAQRAAGKQTASGYATVACRKAISSGLFSDGDGNGSMDAPRALVKRQDLAVVLDRAGMLDG